MVKYNSEDHPEVTSFEKQVITDLDFSGQDLSGMNFSWATIKGCNFAQANLSGANLRYVGISTSSMRGVNFTGADLTGACFCTTDLDISDFYKSIFHYVTLRHTNLHFVKGLCHLGPLGDDFDNLYAIDHDDCKTMISVRRFYGPFDDALIEFQYDEPILWALRLLADRPRISRPRISR